MLLLKRYIRIFLNREGFTLFMVLASIVIMGIAISIGVKQWKVIVKRDKEAELLFRGDQIRRAIGNYFNKPGAKKYPTSLEDLLGDDTTKKRYLRRVFKDPITNKDFELLGGKNVIYGVRSTSEDTPVKSGNFPELYECFEEASTYKDWVFVYITQSTLKTPSSRVKTAKGAKTPKPVSQLSPCDAVAHLKVIKKES